MGKGTKKFSSEENKQESNGLMKEDKKSQNGDVPKEVAEDDDYIAPPDGGWGWMVVFSSFLIHVIADGIVYSFGVFLMEFVDYFNSGRGATSWVGSLQPAVTFTVGPLSSALTNRYGCRKVTIVGAIIASCGFVLSVFAPNLYYLYFTSGIMAGVGFGLIYLPAIVCVAQYFEKRRSFATGLAVCGSGFGTFILAPITEMLVHEYSWQGAMLILGGIILNVVVCGIIFRPLEPEVKKMESMSEDADALLGEDDTAATTSQMDRSIEMEELEILVGKDLTVTKSGGDGEGGDGERGEGEALLTAEKGLEIISSLQQMKALPNGNAVLMNESNASGSNNNQNTPESAPSTPTPTPTTNTEPAQLASGPSNATSSHNTQVVTGYSSDPEETKADSVSQSLSVPAYSHVAAIACSDSALNKYTTFHRSISQQADEGLKPGGVVVRRKASTSESHASSLALSPLHRKDIFYSGSLLNIPMYRSHPDVYKTTVTVHDSDVRSMSEVDGDGKQGGCGEMTSEFRRTMRDMLSMALLKNPVFLMFAISNFFTSIGFNMPFIFLPDRAKLAGIDEDRAALLLSVIGIANTAGRVIFGFLSDRTWVNRLMLYNTALTICGVATALSPVVGGDYGLLVAYAAVFGMFIGVYVSLTSVVLVDLLGLEYLTNSFGLLLLFQGAATFVGPPIAGWLCDWTGSYDISFIVMGSLIAVSGCMLYFLPCVERYHARRVPMVTIVHDIELGKHPVTEEEEEMLSVNEPSSMA